MDTYEKKYKDLEAKIKKAHLFAQTDSTKAVLEDILPELAESEDERIRKAILTLVRENEHNFRSFCGVLFSEMAAYLEKQKEQKPTNGIYWHAIKKGERLPCPAYIWTTDFEKYYDSFDGRLLPNMENAKVGADTWYLPAKDVRDLPREGVDELPKEQKPVYDAKYYDLHNILDDFLEGRDTYNSCLERIKSAILSEQEPGKEQKPAEWSEDDEKIIQSLIREIDKYVFFAGIEANKIVTFLKSLHPTKRGWSEEDEENFAWFDKFFRAESVVAGGRDIPQDKYLWFKSLRPQVKQEWSEEDERILNRLIRDYEEAIKCSGNVWGERFQENLAWLKSLRPSWKPSEEQMEALRKTVNKLENTDVADSVRLSIMYDNLKKLL